MTVSVSVGASSSSRPCQRTAHVRTYPGAPRPTVRRRTDMWRSSDVAFLAVRRGVGANRISLLSVPTFERLLADGYSRPDRRGREFERLCRVAVGSAPEYRTQLRHVWLWDEWPGRWAADAGIDLVAEAVDGTVWAIQAKAYDPAYAIKKADVDSFLSESARSEFHYRLLIATTDRIGQTARRTLAGQEKPAGVLLRSQLALADVRWPSSPADLGPRTPIKKRPRPSSTHRCCCHRARLRFEQPGSACHGLRDR